MAGSEMPQRYNAAVELLDRNLEEGHGNRVAMRTLEGEWTYGQLASGANRVGNALRALGVEIENRVIISLPGSFEFVTTHFGALKIGAVPVSLGITLAVDAYVDALNLSRAKVAVVSAPVAALLRQALHALPYLKRIVVTDEPAETDLRFGEWTAAQSDTLAAADTYGDDMCVWLFSSGTTGHPKAAVYSHRVPQACADLLGHPVFSMSDRSSALSVAPLSTSYGLATGLWIPFHLGASACLLAGPPTAPAVAEVVRRLRPTHLFGIPTNFAAMLALPYLDFRSVQVCYSAGEPLGESLAREWAARTGLTCLSLMGSTEALGFIADRAGRPPSGSLGQAVDGYEAKVVDEDGIKVPDGEIGDLMVKGEAMFTFYWNQWNLTRRTVIGEWCRTGDKVVRDAQGYFHYKGRSDDMFKSGGLWVSPLEIEAVIMSQQDVREAAVVDAPDEAGLARPEAYVVLVPGTEGSEAVEQALREHVRQQLPSHMRPRAYHFVPALPRGAGGKLLRAKLRPQSARA